MTKNLEIEYLAKDIQRALSTVEFHFFEDFVIPSYNEEPSDRNDFIRSLEEDSRTYLYYGTREVFFKICLFLELKNLPLYRTMFVKKFAKTIESEKLTLESYAGRYNDSEPSLIIHDEFRDFLSAFHEFNFDQMKKFETNKLKLILENTNSIISKTNVNVTNETSIYTPVKWFTEVIYPQTKKLNKARFIKKFGTYQPDILIPEISSAVEYKFIRKGQNPEKFLNELKVDANNYTDDPDYKIFYAVIYYKDKGELNPEAFKQAVLEKEFPDYWIIMAL